MDCIASSEIDKYQQEIDPSEMWYQPDNSGLLTMAPNEGENLFNKEQIRQIACNCIFGIT